jgi:pimeloyl-ACP methyl ester carboxylesterase
MPGTPFPLRIAEPVLHDLHRRLDATRWTDTIPGSGWEHGSDLATIADLAAHWRDGFNWRARESLLDDVLPSYTVQIDGRRLHYAHLPGKGPAPFPLLLLHGWPGSFTEFYKVASALADPAGHGGDANDAFDVIVPSLPGHGFSDAPPSVGFGADQCADLLAGLMTSQLGYERFGAQGGDRGAFVATSLGHRHPDLVTGIHLNMPGGIPAPEHERSADEVGWLRSRAQWQIEEGGYSAIQSTKPQTVAFGLRDSPVGTLAWIVEKWRTWSDNDGDVLTSFTADELLTNVMVYWVTGTQRSSMHWYYEHRRNPPAFVRPVRVDVPTGVAVFPKEIARVPRSAVERKYDVRRWTEVPRGGHFAAMEQPDVLVEEIRAFFRPLR